MLKRIWSGAGALLLMSGCGRLQTIPYQGQSPETWCDSHPCVPVDLGFTDFILTEPTSSLIIYALGILTIAIGWHLYKRRRGEKSRLWFARALFFWGIAALLAGTSYQAFGYEIKCAGRQVCAWTSWWEIYYYMFQSFSMNAFVVAVSYSSAVGRTSQLLRGYAIANAVIYNIILFTGAFIPNQFMISFELFTLISAPSFLLLFIVNTANYRKSKNTMELRLLWLWLLQGIIIIIYFAYLLAGYTEKLWQKGIWFTANDVLHILIIGWQLYIFFFVIDKLKDKETNLLS